MLSFEIHPKNPQARLIQQVVAEIQRGGVIVYPTDSGYALGCQMGNKESIARIKNIRQLDEAHHFTLMCRDLSEIATYARIDNSTFRLLKAHTPGPYTFILTASKAVPRMLQHPKQKTIGIRVSENKTAQAILQALDQPLMSVSLILPGGIFSVTETDEVQEVLAGRVDLMVDGGACTQGATTVVDLTGGVPEVIRKGQGDIRGF